MQGSAMESMKHTETVLKYIWTNIRKGHKCNQNYLTFPVQEIFKKPNYLGVEDKVQTILQQNTQLGEWLFSLKD